MTDRTWARLLVRAAELFLLLLATASPLLAEEAELAARPGKAMEGVLRRAEVREIVESADEGDLDTSARRVAEVCLRSPAVLFDLLTGSAAGRERRILRAAFSELPSEEVAAVIQGELAGEPTVEIRLFCLEALAACAAPDALPACLAIVGDLPPNQLKSRRTVNRIGAALADLIRRHPASGAAMARSFKTMSPGARDCTLAAADALGGSTAVRILSELLVLDAEPRGAILSMIARQPVTAREAHTGAQLRAVRAAAEDPAPKIRRAAVLAQGRLNDTATFEAMIARLSDKVARGAACRSLVRMSGYRLIADPARWSAWFRAEQTWLAKCQAREVAALADTDKLKVLVVLQSLARHRLYRDRITPHVTRLTSDRSAEIRRAACETLGELADPEAIPELFAALDDPDEDVKSAADQALRQVTGLKPAATARGWSSVLDLDVPIR